MYCYYTRVLPILVWLTGPNQQLANFFNLVPRPIPSFSMLHTFHSSPRPFSAFQCCMLKANSQLFNVARFSVCNIEKAENGPGDNATFFYHHSHEGKTLRMLHQIHQMTNSLTSGQPPHRYIIS